MRKMINICVKYSKICVILFTLLTVFWAWKAKDVQLDSNVRNVFPKEENTTYDNLDSYLFIGFEAYKGQELFTLEGLQTLKSVIDNVQSLPEVNKSISILNTETLHLKRGGRLVPGTVLPDGRAPKTEEELIEFKNKVLSDPFFEKFLVCNDGKYIITAFLTEEGSEDNILFNQKLTEYVQPLKKHLRVSVSGDLPLINRAEYYLTRDFSTLLAAALIVMLVILFISFRARRALLLPVLVVIMGVIWTVGFISAVGFKLSVVTCVVPALVLTIGSSYTIHVLNEFFRNAPSRPNSDKKWISRAINHVNKTIILASLTTIIGFLSLLGGSQQVIKQFALSVSFGVATTAVLSLFLLPAIFSMLKDPRQIHLRVTNQGKLTVLLGALGKNVVKIKYLLVVLGFMICLSAIYFIPKLTIGSDYYDYFPKGDDVIEESMHVIRMSGGTHWINLTLESEEEGYFGTFEGLSLLSDLEDKISESKYVYDIVSMVSYLKKINKLRFGDYEIPERKGLIVLLKRNFTRMFDTDEGFFKEAPLVEKDYKRVTFLIRVYDKQKGTMVSEKDFYKVLKPLEEIIEGIDKEVVPKTDMWGVGYVASTVSRLLLRDQVRTLIISFILVFLVACIYFRSIYYGFVTIIPLITAICVNYIFMVLLKIPLDITTIMVSSVAIGVGVDDAIHFLIQYIKQLQKQPNDIAQVLYKTYKITGRPIVLTTVSIVAGMLVLVLASFLPIGYFGILVSVALIGALIGTLVFLPALLAVMYPVFLKLKSIFPNMR